MYEETVVAESGWRIGPKEKSGCSFGNTPVENANIMVRGEELVLISLRSSKIRQFRGLIPLKDLIGKPIASLGIIRGSKACYAGYSYEEKLSGEVFFLQMEEGRSQFFINAQQAVSRGIDDEPDFAVLAKIGIIPKEIKEEKEQEEEKLKNLYNECKDLREKKKVLLSSLEGTKWLEGRKIYNKIREKEKQIQEKTDQIESDTWKWAKKRINYNDLKQYIDLVDMVDWAGKRLKAIKIALDPTNGPFSPYIFFLEFEDGTFGVPISPVPDEKDAWIEFPLHGLKEAGFISEEEVNEAVGLFTNAQAEMVKRKKDEENERKIHQAKRESDNRLAQIKKQRKEELENILPELEHKLGEFNLGYLNTKKLLTEIANIKKSFKN